MSASVSRNREGRGRWPARLLLLAGMTCAAAQSALAHWSAGPLARVDVYDRTSGAVLAVYEKDGRRYLYTPVLQRDAWLKEQSIGLLDRLFDGRLAPLVAHFSSHRKLKKADVEALRQILKEHDGG